jgi:hypothetical protein
MANLLTRVNRACPVSTSIGFFRKAAHATDRDMSANFISLKEFLAYSRLSESTVRRRVRDGSLRAIQVGGKGKKLLFSVDAFVRSQDSSDSDGRDAPTEVVNLPQSTGMQADVPAGPRPRWARKLARRPK